MVSYLPVRVLWEEPTAYVVCFSGAIYAQASDIDICGNTSFENNSVDGEPHAQEVILMTPQNVWYV